MSGSNILIGQSGGPTAVINATLCGIVQRAQASRASGSILGMRYGIEGFLAEQTIDLGTADAAAIEGLKSTPGSALGSCRYKVTAKDLPTIRALLEKYDVGTLFLIGGNDTMDTVNRIERYCRESGYPLVGIGVPKTVDNDLHGTDHTPGYGSAARYIALSVQQAGRLAGDMQKVDQFSVFQTIGRDAGWLAAASALARKRDDQAPHLIYLPERPITRDAVLKDVKTTIDQIGWCFVVVGEGVLWSDGSPVSASSVADGFANTEFGAMGGASAALNLHQLIADDTGMRGEFQITESLPMCAIDRVSDTDREEAYRCGSYAVEVAADRISGMMVSMVRESSDDYSVRYETVPLSEVAIRAKPLPDEFINEAGNGVTSAFLEYARPLVGNLPEYTLLD